MPFYFDSISFSALLS